MPYSWQNAEYFGTPIPAKFVLANSRDLNAKINNKRRNSVQLVNIAAIELLIRRLRIYKKKKSYKNKINK